MFEQMPATESIENTQEKNLRQKLQNKLKRLATFGITVSALLLSACNNESSTIAQGSDGKNHETVALTKELNTASYHEIQTLDHKVDSLITVLTEELNEKGLMRNDDDKESYKNWYFKNIGSDKLEVVWRTADANNKTTEAFQYTKNTDNEEIAVNVKDVGPVIMNEKKQFGDILYYINSDNTEASSNYSYFGNDNMVGEVTRNSVHVLNDEKTVNTNQDVKDGMLVTLDAFKNKLQSEISSLK